MAKAKKKTTTKRTPFRERSTNVRATNDEPTQRPPKAVAVAAPTQRCKVDTDDEDQRKKQNKKRRTKEDKEVVVEEIEKASQPPTKRSKRTKKTVSYAVDETDEEDDCSDFEEDHSTKRKKTNNHKSGKTGRSKPKGSTTAKEAPAKRGRGTVVILDETACSEFANMSVSGGKGKIYVASSPIKKKMKTASGQIFIADRSVDEAVATDNDWRVDCCIDY